MEVALKFALKGDKYFNTQIPLVMRNFDKEPFGFLFHSHEH